MSRGRLDRGTRLRLIGNVLLVVGVVAGLAIYNAASRRPPDYELPETKAELRQMEMYGGQANVLATEIREGFAGLWQGRSLGVVLAGLGILLCAGCHFVADSLPPNPPNPPLPPKPPRPSNPPENSEPTEDREPTVEPPPAGS